MGRSRVPVWLLPLQLILLLAVHHSIITAQRISARQHQQSPANGAQQQQLRQQQAQQSKALRSRQILTQQQILSQLFSSGDYDPQIRPPVREHAQHPAIVVITSVYIDRVNWHGETAVRDNLLI